MPVNEVSSRAKTSILLSFAVLVLSACMPSNHPALTEETAFAETLPPQTSLKAMETSSSACRIRDEVPAEALTTLSLPELDLRGRDQNLPKDTPPRFATTTQVDISPATYGRWVSTVDDLQVWRLKIISPQALSLSLGFTSFDMPAGGCLFIYSPDHNQVLGPYTMNDNAAHGQLWTPTVDGEEVIIEVSVPTENVSRMQLVLGSINQGYKK